MTDAYVVGIDMTKFQKAGTTKSVSELGARAALMALDDASDEGEHGFLGLVRVIDGHLCPAMLGQPCRRTATASCSENGYGFSGEI